MTAMTKELKAYYVQGDEYGTVAFARSNVVARRNGANELDEQFNAVSCKRIPQLDGMEGNPSAIRRKLVEELGFWQECGHCGCHVCGGEHNDRVWDGEAIFCNPECKRDHDALMARYHRAHDSSGIKIAEGEQWLNHQ